MKKCDLKVTQHQPLLNHMYNIDWHHVNPWKYACTQLVTQLVFACVAPSWLTKTRASLGPYLCEVTVIKTSPSLRVRSQVNGFVVLCDITVLNSVIFALRKSETLYISEIQIQLGVRKYHWDHSETRNLNPVTVGGLYGWYICKNGTRHPTPAPLMLHHPRPSDVTRVFTCDLFDVTNVIPAQRASSRMLRPLSPGFLFQLTSKNQRGVPDFIPTVVMLCL